MASWLRLQIQVASPFLTKPHPLDFLLRSPSGSPPGLPPGRRPAQPLSYKLPQGPYLLWAKGGQEADGVARVGKAGDNQGRAEACILRPAETLRKGKRALSQPHL